MTPTLALDIETITQDETPFCGTHHHQDDVAGYVVVLTQHGRGRVVDVDLFPKVNVAKFGGHPYYPAYGNALDLVRLVRAAGAESDVGYHGRIDVLYNDGCRGIC